VILGFIWWLDWQMHHPHVRAPVVATPTTRRRSRARPRKHEGGAFEFERLIQKTIDELPPEYREAISNVDIVVEDEPPPGQNLFGLYQGIPLTARSRWYVVALPDRISIYRGPIERYCGHDHKLLEQEVRHVVLHELAHHFGISDQRLIEIGRY
jgi:predicted Zn-dependent protease with MMP-like domain